MLIAFHCVRLRLVVYPIFLSHPPAPASSHQSGNSIFFLTALQLQPAERSETLLAPAFLGGVGLGLENWNTI